jgi:hypothetical protein
MRSMLDPQLRRFVLSMRCGTQEIGGKRVVQKCAVCRSRKQHRLGKAARRALVSHAMQAAAGWGGLDLSLGEACPATLCLS